ncbi:hypothetical protein GGS26DRAFT_545181 [Hypomontagnella submonticulosa]|nr:hypothetical protein GGS26DRAFT_545181 [Hypomontagnella submonticulosa]
MPYETFSAYRLERAALEKYLIGIFGSGIDFAQKAGQYVFDIPRALTEGEITHILDNLRY